MFIECDDVLTLKINIIELNHPVCENNNDLYIQHYTLLEENSQEINIINRVCINLFRKAKHII